MTELQLVLAWAAVRIRELRAEPDRGDSHVAAWVIITAIVAGAAITIGAILVAKFLGAANSVQTQ